MLKKETDIIASINKSLAALVAGDLSSPSFPNDLGEFEETIQLLTQVIGSMKDISQQANQIATGNYVANITPRSDRDELGIAMQQMTATLREVANVAELIATGAILDAKVEVKGSSDLLGNSINNMIATLNAVTGQVNILAQGDYLADIKPRSDKDVLGIAMQSMTLTLRQASNVVEEVAKGNLNIAVEVKGKQDLLANAINSMISSLKDISQQANQIATGNYSANITPRSDKDVLGIAMQQMTAALRNITAENEQQNWLKTGQNGINEKMRGVQDETTLARNVITYLAKYLGAQIGALYLKEEDSETLKLMGSYAFSKRKNVNERIQIGEGLVGQAAFEKELISVTNLPDDYTRIGSAIGNAVPRNVVVSPFMIDGQLNGVLEIGAFKEFSDIQMELLNTLRENLAINFNAVRASGKMKDLLKETQNLAEELQTQQEELRVTNEELEEKSKILEVQQEELRVTNEELQEKSGNMAAQSAKLQHANDNLEMQTAEIKQKNAEVEIKAEQLAISSKYKSEFLANMSHELRTPLNSLLLLSNSLAKNKQGNLSEEQIKSAFIIHKGGEDLLNLINEILDLSKVEAGMMELEFDSFFIHELEESLNRNFAHMMKDKGLEFIINIDSKLPASIKSDRKRLEQILKNLISNAIKFTNAGSITVNFSRPAMDINLSKSGLEPLATLAIAVIDTGIGIPVDKQKVVFEAFQQADGGTARKYGGTGLGLSISRELSALLGGEIQLQSQEGTGSTFTLYLSLEGKHEGIKRVEGNSNLNASTATGLMESKSFITQLNYKIEDDRKQLMNSGSRTDDKKIMLLIEDDSKFAQILVNQCHEQGFMCLATSSGEEGLTLVTQYMPDGIVLDIHLPGIDGWHVLNVLKDNPKTRHIPVHIMSVDNERQKAEIRGAVGFVSKPVNQEQLDEAFQKIQKCSSKAIKDLLIIEDDDIARIAIKQLIGEEGVKITEAASGLEGFQTLIAGNFDCVILDLSLPDISGFQMLEKLIAEEGFRIPPVIIYTGKDLSKKEHQQLLKYTDAVVIKGVDSEKRLLDETSLFLHRLIKEMPENKQKIIHDLYNLEAVFKDKKIMVVDDDMRNVFALTQLLEEKEIEVLVAEDGQSALDILKENTNIDLILMDIMMPNMDGYEAMHRIRKQEPFKKLPIIALTAKAMKDDREKCIAAGASDYLSKPIDEQRLFSMMRIWLYK